MKQFFTKKEGKIVRLTLNRPEKMNAISVQMRKEIMAAIE
jgi:enoyl-CoA hydratase/carnithine racemase